MEVKSGTADGLGLLGLRPGALGRPPERLDLLGPGGRGCAPGMLMLTEIWHQQLTCVLGLAN